MRYRVVHRTRYRYSQPVVLCHNEARLQPRATERQRCVQSELVIEPTPAESEEREDFFGNRVLYFAIQSPHDSLVVTASSEIDLSDAAPPVPDAPAWEAARADLQAPESSEARLAAHFALDSPLAAAAPSLGEYARPSFPAGRSILEGARDLSARINRDFEFDPSLTTVATPLAEVLEKRGGVCQDFAHLAIACLRSLGLAARYVSGYLESAPRREETRLRGSEVSHAWFAVFVPGAGWFDFDPTNHHIPAHRHVTTAWGRDYADVTPLKGVIFGGGAHTLEVAVNVARVDFT
jgi:transglutaminase-like putative cysteine protease